MRREATLNRPLYRNRWVTLLRNGSADAVDLTPQLVTRLFKLTFDEFVTLPPAQRPLAFDREHRPMLDSDGKPRPIDWFDLVTEHGKQLVDDLAAAEIIRIDDKYMPELKIKKQKHKDLEQLLNLTFEHPEYGRRRFGMWSPFDASRYVTPKLTTQGLKSVERANECAAVIASCSDPTIPIIDQLNAMPDDDDPQQGGFL